MVRYETHIALNHYFESRSTPVLIWYMKIEQKTQASLDKNIW